MLNLKRFGIDPALRLFISDRDINLLVRNEDVNMLIQMYDVYSGDENFSFGSIFYELILKGVF